MALASAIGPLAIVLVGGPPVTVNLSVAVGAILGALGPVVTVGDFFAQPFLGQNWHLLRGAEIAVLWMGMLVWAGAIVGGLIGAGVALFELRSAGTRARRLAGSGRGPSHPGLPPS
jgi:hypothetical protein